MSERARALEEHRHIVLSSLENVVGTPSRDSLTYFAANHVKGDIGWNALEYFLNLRYLDLSFTDLTIKHFRAAMTSLRLLEHLNLSGTSLTWYEVFCTADVFIGWPNGVV